MSAASEYYWDSRLDYLLSKLNLDINLNDDYLEFLITKVWKLEQPLLCNEGLGNSPQNEAEIF